MKKGSIALQVSSATALMSSPKQDPSLRLNAAVLAGALIEGGESGPSTFYKENGESGNLD